MDWAFAPCSSLTHVPLRWVSAWFPGLAAVVALVERPSSFVTGRWAPRVGGSIDEYLAHLKIVGQCACLNLEM